MGSMLARDEIAKLSLFAPNQVNIELMRDTVRGLEGVVLAVRTLDDEVWGRFLNVDAMRARHVLLLAKEAQNLMGEQARLQRLLREHQLSSTVITTILNDHPVSDWERDVERWRELTRRHYRPWSLDDCQPVIDASLKEVSAFHWSTGKLSTGLRFLGWSDLRRLDAVRGVFQFEFHKVFRGFDMMDGVNVGWDTYTDTKTFQEVIIGPHCLGFHDVLQQLTPNVVIFRGANRFPSIAGDMHGLSIVFRIPTERGFTQCVRSITCPGLVDAFQDPNIVWASNFIWLQWEQLGGAHEKNAYSLRIGGSMKGIDVAHMNQWMIEKRWSTRRPPENGGDGRNDGAGDPQRERAHDRESSRQASTVERAHAERTDDGDVGGGYTVYRSTASKKKAKQRSKLVEAANTSGQNGGAKSKQEASYPTSSNPEPSQRRRAASVKPISRSAKYSSGVKREASDKRAQLPVNDKRILQLGGCVSKNVSTDEVMEIFAMVQRSQRTRAEEEAANFTKEYDRSKPEDCEALRATLIQWFSPTNTSASGISISEFKRRLPAIRLITADVTPVDTTPVSWRAALLNSQDTQSAPVESSESTQKPETQVKQEMSKTAEIPPVPTAAQQAKALLGGAVPLRTRLVLRTAIEDRDQVRLIARLEASMKLHENIGHRGILRQLINMTARLKAQNDAFKQAVVKAQYDAASHWVVFTFPTLQTALKWVHVEIPLQGRMLQLQLPKSTSTNGGLSADEYPLQISDPSGSMNMLGILQLFENGIGCRVKALDIAPADEDGAVDPTTFSVILEHRGCPEQLKGRTSIVSHGFTLWIHHTLFTENPPCTQCGAPDHPRARCKGGRVDPRSRLRVDHPIVSTLQAVRSEAQERPQIFAPWERALKTRATERKQLDPARLRQAEEMPIVLGKLILRAQAAILPEFLAAHLSYLPDEGPTGRPDDAPSDLIRLLEVALARPADANPGVTTEMKIPELDKLQQVFDLPEPPASADPGLHKLLLARWKEIIERDSQVIPSKGVLTATERAEVQAVQEQRDQLRATLIARERKRMQAPQREEARGLKEREAMAMEDSLSTLLRESARQEAAMSERERVQMEIEDLCGKVQHTQDRLEQMRMQKLRVESNLKETRRASEQTQKELSELQQQQHHEELQHQAMLTTLNIHSRVATDRLHDARKERDAGRARLHEKILANGKECAQLKAETAVILAQSTTTESGKQRQVISKAQARRNARRLFKSSLQNSLTNAPDELRSAEEQTNKPVNEVTEIQVQSNAVDLDDAARSLAEQAKWKYNAEWTPVDHEPMDADMEDATHEDDDGEDTHSVASAEMIEAMEVDELQIESRQPSTAEQRVIQRSRAALHSLVVKRRVGLARVVESKRRLRVLAPDTVSGQAVPIHILAQRQLSRPTRQLQVTTFFARAQDGVSATAQPKETKGDEQAADGQDQSDDEVVYIGSLVPIAVPASIQGMREWETLKGALGLLEITTPGNGSCFYYAVHAMTYGECPQVLSTHTRSRAYKEAKYGRYHLNRYIRKFLEEHAYVGTVDLEAACFRITGSAEVTPESVQKVKAHLKRAERQPCNKQVDAEYYAGEMEISTMAHWIGVPVFVFDLTVDGRIPSVSLYYPCLAMRPTYAGQETVCRRYMPVQAASKLISKLIRREIVPHVMVLRQHSAGNKLVGHFNALRVPDADYKAWAGTEQRRRDMRIRMHSVFEAEGFYPSADAIAEPQAAAAMPPSTHADSTSSTPASPQGSIFEPSQCPTEPDLQTDVVRVASPTLRQLIGAGCTVHPPDEETKESEPPVHHRRSEALAHRPMEADDSDQDDFHSAGSTASDSDEDSSSGSSAMSVEVVPYVQPASPAYPLSQLTAEEWHEVLCHCTRELAASLGTLSGYDKVVHVNTKAYEDWLTRCHENGLPVRSIVAGCLSLPAACAALVAWPAYLVDLLRSTPHAPVIFGYPQADTMVSLGRAVIISGRQRQLEGLVSSAELPDATRRECAEWSTQLRAASPEMQWEIAQSQALWDRLVICAPTAVLSTRSVEGVTDEAWGCFLATMLFCPMSLPPTVAQLDFAAASAYLIQLTSDVRGQQATAGAIREFFTGDWLAPTRYGLEVFGGDVPRGLDGVDSSMSEGPRRY